MKKLLLDDIISYVEKNINTFHEKRISRVTTLQLKDVLRKKNPYLFKAKHLLTSNEIIMSITDAFISSNEETIFGDWLEGLAIFIHEKTYGGRKSGIQGIDLEFDNNGIRYLVNIKSVPNWGNSSQIKKMVQDFKSAAKTLRTSNSNVKIIAVNGCCYGIDKKPDKGDYFKYCGEKFWEFISDTPGLYPQLIEPIGYKSKERTGVFQVAYTKMINKFTREFSNEYCNVEGEIIWDKLVKYNSGN